MKRTVKRAAVISLVMALLFTAVLSPGLPWSARIRQNILRLVVKAEARVASLKGEESKLVSLKGRFSGTGAQVEALRGARVFALESTSGYTALTDSQSSFTLPHVLFYPGADYTLVVLTDSQSARQFRLTAPVSPVEDSVIDFGDIRFDEGFDVAFKDVPVRYMKYDDENSGYYRTLFERLTADARTDEEKIDAVCRYIATKLTQGSGKRDFRSPREIIGQGASLCSDLALAMAAITESGNYPTRTVHTSDSPEYRNTHVVVEVYYKDRWHLYDPTYGVHFLNRRGSVASYKELRLDPELITVRAFQSFKPRTIRGILDWMPGTYLSGFHQIYHVDSGNLCAVW